MIALDSSVWIESWFDDAARARVGREIRRLGGDPEQVVVPVTVIYETCRWLIRHLGDEDVIDTLMASLRQHDLVGIDDRVAQRAALTSITTGLAHADAMILAAARTRHATLLTFDTDFEGIADVVVLPR